MTPQEQLDAVRTKVIEVCPELKATCVWHNVNPLHEGCEEGLHNGNDIRISHVLRATAETRHAVTVNTFGRIQAISPEVSADELKMDWRGCDWNLVDDDLSLQSPETIQFLFNILCE